jgi:hypothetical protein
MPLDNDLTLTLNKIQLHKLFICSCETKEEASTVLSMHNDTSIVSR